MQCLEYSPVKYSVLLCRLANKQKSFYSGITDRHIFIYTAIQAGKTTIPFHQPIVMGIKINCIDRGSSTLPFPALCIFRTQFICRTFGRNSIRNSALCRCTRTHTHTHTWFACWLRCLLCCFSSDLAPPSNWALHRGKFCDFPNCCISFLICIPFLYVDCRF